MAEFDELDSRLRDALGQAAEHGDSTGVADAIRSRVAAGDSGASVAGDTAPGWGGGSALGWLPWLGLIVVVGLVGGAIGASGLVGREEGETVVDIPIAIGESAPVAACVEGPVVGRIPAGTRALAVQRSDDALWVGIRDPRTLGGTLWVGLGDISLDDGTPALDALPVGGACPPEAVVVIPVEPAPVPSEEPAPAPAPAPAPGTPTPAPGDTTRPTLGGITMTTGNCSFVVTIPASDNVGVTGVTLSWANAQYPVANGSAPMAPQGGGVWRYEFAQNPMLGFSGDYSVTATARDAAGNTATSGTVTKNVQCLG